MKRSTFACNGASAKGHRDVARLEYQGKSKRNVRIGLPAFVTDLLHLPDEHLDLLELAAYVYAGDRSASRGPTAAVEYHAWSRRMKFLLRVRDADFWNDDKKLPELLAGALDWMTGDDHYDFSFTPGHSTAPANLFDAARVALPQPATEPAILLFSGGLDSLAGALSMLDETERPVVLVSHQSASRTKKTQDALVAALQSRFGSRVSHYPFECTLAGARGKEETQRSRSFLYTAIAATIALAHGCADIYVFENGVTSINLARRQDLINARASRTTHPQTLGRLAAFFSAFARREFKIHTPLLYCTKATVIDTVARLAPDLVESVVLCNFASAAAERP